MKRHCTCGTHWVRAAHARSLTSSACPRSSARRLYGLNSSMTPIARMIKKTSGCVRVPITPVPCPQENPSDGPAIRSRPRSGKLI